MVKNHRGRPMSQPERAFWRDAFLNARPPNHRGYRGPTAEASIRADYADAAVEEYRKRITWRQS